MGYRPARPRIATRTGRRRRHRRRLSARRARSVVGDVDLADDLDVEFGAELSRAGAGDADDPLGVVLGEVSVDADFAVLVSADAYGAVPLGDVAGPVGGVAAAQHEQVGDDLGAGGALVR